jgi:tetratricopeptide (TPR) repeat protein
MTAHYNAYFIANERIKEISLTIEEGYDWNYNKILPIFAQFDTTDSKNLEAQLEDCIEKASIAIQRHPGSRWEDDSYVLVGKARHFGSEFADAIETFKYVNKHSENDDTRHEALIELVKAFVEFDEINNAIAVSDYLKKEDLSNKNLRNLYLNRAYMFQKRNDLDQLVQNLVQADKYMSNGEERARIDFIIGQVYQSLGFEAEAYNYYARCLRNGPPYELAFYAKLNMAQVTQLAESNDRKKIKKYFKKLLRDPKNIEYNDKIYYEYAGFELKQGNLDQAIVLFKKSIQKSLNNPRQKGYSYLKLGQIYFDSLKNYKLAQNYYDSTVNTMPKDEDGFEKIEQRQKILTDFIIQVTTIHKNDSLIQLSSLSEDSLRSIAMQIVNEQNILAKAKEKKEKKKAAQATRNSFNQNTADLITTSTSPGATWYFYNSSAISSGRSSFLKQWGNRQIEDNWRRSNKSGGEIIAGQVQENEKSAEREESSEESSEENNVDNQVSEMIAAVPKTEEQIKKLLSEIEVALYKLGNIYSFQLEEKQNAANTFEQQIERFINSEYKPEILYQLFLIEKGLGNVGKSDLWANQLKEEFPDSLYAKLVDNPNYREESQAATAQLKKAYQKAYRLYSRKQYAKSNTILDSALNIFPENDFSDNLALLNVINTGELDGVYKYQFELNNFLKTYPESDVIAYAQTLVKASEDYQINLFNSASAKFIKFFTQTHFMVVAYKNDPELSQKVPVDVEAYIKEKNFNFQTGNIILNENFALVLVNDFPGKGTASKFLEMFDNDFSLADKYKGERFYTFVITEDNFDIFYQTKDLTAYLNFYDKNYP